RRRQNCRQGRTWLRCGDGNACARPCCFWGSSSACCPLCCPSLSCTSCGLAEEIRVMQPVGNRPGSTGSSLLGVLHPALAPDRRSWVIWSLHLLLLAAVLAGLYWVNLFFDVPRKIPGYRLLAHLWL